jgi:putative ABC transport system substrate-binding protein
MMARHLLVAIVATLGLLPAAFGQPAAKVYRDGFLAYRHPNTPDDHRNIAAFRQRLHELGFVEGTNLVIEWRFTEGRNERYADFAAELVRLKADAVIAGTGAAARAVMAVSRTIPIVTVAVPDPVRSGLVASLARPGGQLTGLTNLSGDLVPKQLELLKAALPAAKRVAYLRCTSCLAMTGANQAEITTNFRVHAEAASRLGLVWQPLDVNERADFAGVAARLRSDPPDALLLGANQITFTLQREWHALVTELRVPTFAAYRAFGATLSYGPEYAGAMRRVADYVARILRGAWPGQLAMEQPTLFEFVVNAKAMRAMGLEVTPDLRMRADVILE